MTDTSALDCLVPLLNWINYIFFMDRYFKNVDQLGGVVMIFILLGADWSSILPYFFVLRDRVMKSIFASTI
ncbi:hypothetical protein PKHYL_12900 [Psychrobacter sp. KH172YL61]|nr:hypothetical protein PKHYL_12900 [Psychrobacter sp. KH172YL61]